MTATNKSIVYESQLSTWITEHLYLNELYADFYFHFNLGDDNSESLPVHKAILSAASKIFKSTFNESETTNTVEIVDVSIDSFKEFLQFFYLEKVKVTMTNIAEVMSLGRKYEITACIDVCKQFLKSTLDDDNICWGYGLAINWNEIELKKFCEEYIKRNTKPVFSSKSFLECDRRVLSHILKLDCLSCRESDIFEACLNWVKAVNKQEQLTGESIRSHLGDSIYYIHFGSIPIAKLAAFNETYKGLFTPEEYAEILQMNASKDFQPTIFRGNRRKCFEIQWNEEVEINCNRLFWDKPIGPYFVKAIDSTTLSSNKTLWLGAIICQILFIYKGKNEYDEDEFETFKKDVPTEITIAEMPSNRLDDKEIVYKGNAVLEANIDRDHTRIVLEKPLLVRSGYLYEIQMKQSLPDAICTYYPLSPEVKIKPGIVVTFHNTIAEDDDGLTRGLIPGLKFMKV